MICPPDSLRHCQTRAMNGLAAQVVAVAPLGGELLLDHVLGGDAGMVGAGHPQHLVAGHALPAAQDVLQGVVQGVPHVQDAGDVGRRDDDGVVGFGGLFVGMKTAAFLPDPVPLVLNVLGFVPLGEFRFHKSCSFRLQRNKRPAGGQNDPKCFSAAGLRRISAGFP